MWIGFGVGVGASLALAACGAEAPRARTLARVAAAPVDAGAKDADQEDAPIDPMPTVARIAASAAALAPGMRELARLEEEAPFERTLVRGAERDTCVRVAFAASEPVVAMLVDGAGGALETTPRAASGVTAVVCVARAGDLVLRVTGGADRGPNGPQGRLRVRGVAFAAP